MDGDGQKTPAYKWPGEWVRQESFWREVGTRTLAAIFAAGFIYLFALAAGYVSRPDASRTLATLAVLLLMFVAVPALAFVIVGRTRSKWVAAGAILMVGAMLYAGRAFLFWLGYS